MILFCEDCGQKNTVDDHHTLTGRAVFICASCGYANNYALGKLKPESDRRIQPLLDNICRDKDVIGAFVYNAQNGCIISRMPDFLAADDLKKMGRLMSQSLMVLLKDLPDMTDLTLNIANKYLHSKPLISNFILIVVTCAAERSDFLQKIIDTAGSGSPIKDKMS